MEVAALAAGPTVAVTVADSCDGIPPADLDAVYEAGWRGDAARSGGGMGLGLAIARDVAIAHGGTLVGANRPDGSGCVFTPTLPVVRGPRDLTER